MLRIEITDAAEADLDEVFDWGSAAFGQPTAIEYLRSLQASFGKIARFPDAARLVPFKPSLRVKPFRSHVVVYQVSASRDMIIILRVRHGREDWLADLQGED